MEGAGEGATQQVFANAEDYARKNSRIRDDTTKLLKKTESFRRQPVVSLDRVLHRYEETEVGSREGAKPRRLDGLRLVSWNWPQDGVTMAHAICRNGRVPPRVSDLAAD
jgi:hypothetical protein